MIKVKNIFRLENSKQKYSGKKNTLEKLFPLTVLCLPDDGFVRIKVIKVGTYRDLNAFSLFGSPFRDFGEFS